MKRYIWIIIAITVLALVLHCLGWFYQLETEKINRAISLLATLFSFLSGFIFIIYTKASEFAILKEVDSDTKFKDNYKIFLEDLKPINCMFHLYLFNIILIIVYSLTEYTYLLLPFVLSSSIISIFLSFGLPHFYEHPIRNKANRILRQRNE